MTDDIKLPTTWEPRWLKTVNYLVTYAGDPREYEFTVFEELGDTVKREADGLLIFNRPRLGEEVELPAGVGRMVKKNIGKMIHPEDRDRYVAEGVARRHEAAQEAQTRRLRQNIQVVVGEG